MAGLFAAVLPAGAAAALHRPARHSALLVTQITTTTVVPAPSPARSQTKCPPGTSIPSLCEWVPSRPSPNPHKKPAPTKPPSAAPAGKTAANRPANASPHDARPGHDFTRRRSPSTARQHRDCQVESHACTSASTERRASSKPRRRRTVTETPPGVNPAWKGFTTETRVPDVLIKTVTKLRTEGTATTQSRRRSQRGCECRKDGKTNLRSPSL